MRRALALRRWTAASSSLARPQRSRPASPPPGPISQATPAPFSSSTKAGGARAAAPSVDGAPRRSSSSPSFGKKADLITTRALRAAASCFSFLARVRRARTDTPKRSAARGKNIAVKAASAAPTETNFGTQPTLSLGIAARRASNWASRTRTRTRTIWRITKAEADTRAAPIAAIAHYSPPRIAFKAGATLTPPSSIVANGG